MKLTRETDYAMRAVLQLTCATEMTLTAEDLSVRSGVPREFMKKILTRLVRTGIVRSERGSCGGVTLARSPEELTILEILVAIEGPLRLNRCLEAPPACPHVGSCAMQAVWVRAQRAVEEILSGATFADMAKSKECSA